MKKNVAIAVGLILGLAFGLIAAATGAPALQGAAHAVAPLGTAFVNLVKMVVVPLVATTLFTGVASLGDLRKLGRMGAVTLGFFWSTTLLGILLGMGLMGLALPLAGPAGTIHPTGGVTPPALPGVVEFLVGLVPSNAVEAAAKGELLPLIVFTVLFGAAAGLLPADDKRRLLDLADAVTKVLITLVHWILWTAPVGVFALAAPVTADTGLAMLQSLGVFVGTVLVGLVLLVAAFYLPAVRFGGGRSPLAFLRASAGMVPIAFSTTSSNATLPAMFEAAEDRMGISRSVTSFVLPVGASLNRAGSALFQGSAVIYLAHVYGVTIPSAVAVAGAVGATFLVALTVAGVPSASVMTLPPALAAVGVPLDGLGLLLGIDRVPDMFRTSVNVLGDVAACPIVERAVERLPERSDEA